MFETILTNFLLKYKNNDVFFIKLSLLNLFFIFLSSTFNLFVNLFKIYQESNFFIFYLWTIFNDRIDTKIYGL